MVRKNTKTVGRINPTTGRKMNIDANTHVLCKEDMEANNIIETFAEKGKNYIVQRK